MLKIMGKNVANNFALIFDNCVLSFIILDFYLSIFIFYVFYFPLQAFNIFKSMPFLEYL